MCHTPFRTKADGEPLEYTEHYSLPCGKDIPAWSLGRLIEMLPSQIQHNKDLPSFSDYAFLDLHKVSVSYEYDDYDGNDCVFVSFYGNGFFNAVVDCTEWLIKEGYFNKQYLEE